MQFSHGKGLPSIHEKSCGQRIYDISMLGVNMKNNKQEMIMHKVDTGICQCSQGTVNFKCSEQS
jgi:hypothetical protein